VLKIHDDVVTIIRRPDFQERLAKDAIEPVANSPEAFAAQIKTDLGRWAKIVKAANAKLD
jgi:tripartite-type tricarboxylate transporter receptor subunit TctC